MALQGSALLFAVGIGASCVVTSDDEFATRRSAIIYGTDDRQEAYEEVDPSVRALFANVAAVIPKDAMEPVEGSYELSSATAGEALLLCDGEPYAQQPAAAQCTALLLSEHLAVTAGHCFTDEEDCQQYNFVLDFAYQRPGVLSPITDQGIFDCRRLLIHVRRTDPTSGGADFAIVELANRTASVHPSRVALPHLRDEPIENGTKLTVISATSGLPLKVDRGARGRPIDDAGGVLFELDSDTFSGSSGAPIWDAQGELVGFIARGNRDFAYDEERACYVTNKLDDWDMRPSTQRLERATSVSHVVRALCALNDDTAQAECDQLQSPSQHGVGCSAYRALPLRTHWATWILFLFAVVALRRSHVRAVRGESHRGNPR
jgi:hypothetical protein